MGLRVANTLVIAILGLAPSPGAERQQLVSITDPEAYAVYAAVVRPAVGISGCGEAPTSASRSNKPPHRRRCGVSAHWYSSGLQHVDVLALVVDVDSLNGLAVPPVGKLWRRRQTILHSRLDTVPLLHDQDPEANRP